MADSEQMRGMERNELMFQDPEVVGSTCSKCGGYGMYPCTVCEGSRRSYTNYHGAVILRCTHCDKGGLMVCDECN